MLGMTIACARCHDHKFDPIPTTDYYAMAGIFRSTETFAGSSRQEEPLSTDACSRWLTRKNTSSVVGRTAQRCGRRISKRSPKLEAEIDQATATSRQASKKTANAQKGEGQARLSTASWPAPKIDQKAGARADQEAGRRLDEARIDADSAGQLGDGGRRSQGADQLPGAGARRIEGQGAGGAARRADRAQDARSPTTSIPATAAGWSWPTGSPTRAIRSPPA